MSPLADTLARAVHCHQRGEFQAAEELYRRIVAESPRHADAWHLLGVLAQQQGHPETAVELIAKAVDFSGPHPLLFFNLANAKRQLRQHAGAIADYRRAIELQPDFPEAYLNLAAELQTQGDLRGAADSYRRILQTRPHFAEAYFNLGLLGQKQGRVAEANEHFQHTLRLDASHAPARFNLAQALADQGQLTAAADHYRQYLAGNPSDARGHSNLGGVLLDLDEAAAARESFRMATQLVPSCAEAFYNLGLAQARQAHDNEALIALQQAAELQPNFAAAQYRLADALANEGRTSEAETRFRLAVKLRPDNLLWQMQAASVLPLVPDSSDQIDEQRAQLSDRWRRIGESSLDCDLAEISDSQCKPPLTLAYQGRDDRPLKAQFAAIFERRWNSAPAKARKHGRPRIGFVVTPGHEGIFLRGMAGVLNHLTPGRFEPVVLSGLAAQTRCRQAITNPEVQFLNLPARFEQTLAAVQAADCDLLYHWEIGTDSVNYFLPMFRLAAVQCASWGWPVTSGMQAVDYFISSQHLEPADADDHYTEQLVRLSRLPNYYARPAGLSPVADRAHFGLPTTGAIYACVQNPTKIHPDCDALFANLLRHDPQGLLVLIEAARPIVTQSLRQRFQAHAADVAERICFLPRMGRSDYLKLIASADVVLDTLHYGGGANTTYDALGQGVPVVTWPGRYHRGRYALACYRLMQIDDCIAHDPGEFVQIAQRLAGNRDYRHSVSQRILATVDCLFDDLAAVRELEEFFETAVATARAK